MNVHLVSWKSPSFFGDTILFSHTPSFYCHQHLPPILWICFFFAGCLIRVVCYVIFSNMYFLKHTCKHFVLDSNIHCLLRNYSPFFSLAVPTRTIHTPFLRYFPPSKYAKLFPLLKIYSSHEKLPADASTRPGRPPPLTARRPTIAAGPPHASQSLLKNPWQSWAGSMFESVKHGSTKPR